MQDFQGPESREAAALCHVYFRCFRTKSLCSLLGEENINSNDSLILKQKYTKYILKSLPYVQKVQIVIKCNFKSYCRFITPSKNPPFLFWHS